MIHMSHPARVFEQTTIYDTTEWYVECPCGWKEKGYGRSDCESKANDHTRKVSDVSLALPLTMQGRRGWLS